ncbi:MAG: host-nuclease inhibitor Gam family protein [Oscillospiraceae bacterium]|nr:host-nuclease inhibitor Gam family protein [Oscillospiraceae bacterium]
MEENNAFEIDTPEKANWAIKKIKEARKIRDVYIDVAKAEIAEYEQKIQEAEARCENDTAYLTAALSAYMESGEIPTKSSKTQMVAVLPDGKLKIKLPQICYEKDDAALLDYLLENAPEYIKTEQTPQWGEFKRLLAVHGDAVVRTDTGELVVGVSAKENPGKFLVE